MSEYALKVSVICIKTNVCWLLSMYKRGKRKQGNGKREEGGGVAVHGNVNPWSAIITKKSRSISNPIQFALLDQEACGTTTDTHDPLA